MSSDNYLNMYIIPNMKLIRSIIISPSISYFSFVNSPIPCIVLYDSITRTIVTQGINTHDIIALRVIEDDDFISPVLCKNYNFAQYLCYGCSNGNNVKIVKLPYLKEINKYTHIFKEDNIRYIMVNAFLSSSKNTHYILTMSSKNKICWLLSKPLPEQNSNDYKMDRVVYLLV